jgi:hypothetical protein
MQKARGQRSRPPKGSRLLPPLVGTRFQDLFHPPPGVLFTFPSRYSCAIGHRLVFRLGRWSCQLRPGFLVSRPTQGPGPIPNSPYAYGTLTLFGPPFQTARLPAASDRRIGRSSRPGPPTPTRQRLPPSPPRGFGLLPVRSPLLGESLLFPLPPGTEMFQFPGFAPGGLWIQPPVTALSNGRVAPFGHPRINACVRLPAAFRS